MRLTVMNSFICFFSIRVCSSRCSAAFRLKKTRGQCRLVKICGCRSHPSIVTLSMNCKRCFFDFTGRCPEAQWLLCFLGEAFNRAWILYASPPLDGNSRYDDGAKALNLSTQGRSVAKDYLGEMTFTNFVQHYHLLTIQS